MKSLFTSLVLFGLSGVFLASAAVNPRTFSPTRGHAMESLTQNSYSKSTAVLAEMPLPDPHSPNSPLEMPLPDPHSPNSPLFAFEMPLPDPHSPNSPLEMPLPDPHSPNSPLFVPSSMGLNS